MKKTVMQGTAYEAPALELLTVSVEQGFATSVTGDVIEDWEDDGDGLNFN